MNARSIKTVYSYLQAKHKQIVLTYGETLVRKLEDYIAKISLIPNATFFDADQFSWVQLLEANWHTKTAFFQFCCRINTFQSIEVCIRAYCAII